MKTKKHLVLSTLIASVVSAQAGVVYFGAPDQSATNWNDATMSPEIVAGESVTYTRVQDGVTFKLTLTGYTDYTGARAAAGITTFGNGGGLGVSGGTSSSANTRVSNNGAEDAKDDEYIEATLSVSGVPLRSLSLRNLNIRYADGRNQHFVDQDGNTFSSDSGNGDWNNSNLQGINGLSVDNVEDWSLAMGIIDGAEKEANQVSAYGQIAFEYEVIPEPATLGLIASVGGCVMFARRFLTL